MPNKNITDLPGGTFAAGHKFEMFNTLANQNQSVTIPAQTVQTQNCVDATLGGNTAGVLALINSGTMTLAGGNNITLSQAGNAVTISAGAGGAAGTQTFGMSNLGNTSGTTGVATGTGIQFFLAGGNNVTLSQSLNGASGTITISAFTQTVQTQNCVDATLAGNTSGALALINSGTMTLAGGNNITLSQAGNAVTISAGAGGAAGTNTIGMSNIGNTSGDTTPVTGSNIRVIFAGGNNVTLSQSTNGSSATITISAAAAAGPTLTWWQNVNIANTGQMQLGSLGITYNSMGVYPLNQDGVFPGNMTVNTMHMLLTLSGSTATMSQAFTSSIFVGIYTNNASTLSLLNSVVTTFGSGADNANLSTIRVGGRFLTIHSSAWSAQPVFSAGHYYVGVIFRSSSRSDQTAAYWGQEAWSQNTVLSGSIGVSQVNATTVGFQPWHGVYSVSTGSLPSVVSSNDLNKQVAALHVIPCIQFNNLIQSF